MVDNSRNSNQLPAFREGSEPAFIDLFNKLHSRLYQYIFGQLQDKETAGAVLEDAFADAWQLRRSFKSEDQLVRFLYCNACININNRRKEALLEHCWLSPDVAGNEKEIEEDKSVFARRPMIALDKLPGQQKKFIGKRHIEGKSVKEIAEKEPKPLSDQTVTNHIYRGMKTLREDLKKP
jgi:RNA polymerase sigma-70 factor (ECF subfamily)